MEQPLFYIGLSAVPAILFQPVLCLFFTGPLMSRELVRADSIPEAVSSNGWIETTTDIPHPSGNAVKITPLEFIDTNKNGKMDFAER